MLYQMLLTNDLNNFWICHQMYQHLLKSGPVFSSSSEYNFDYIEGLPIVIPLLKEKNMFI